MRGALGLCLVAVVFVAGCGGGDGRPDLAAPPPTTERAEPAPTTTRAIGTATQSVTAVGAPTRLSPGARQRIAETARDAAAAVRRWNASLDACLGPSGTDHEAGALCTREAWEQLFDQIYSVQYELLSLGDRLGPGPCHDALASAIDSSHGFLSGATPLKVVWLDDRQQPPLVYDLESIVDVARPLPARLRLAEAKCSG